MASRVARHLRDGRRAALDALFKAGDEIHALRISTGLGACPVARLAALLEMDESQLQKWGRLAEMVRDEERDVLCGLADRSGLPLKPSLIVELERVRDAATRSQLARVSLERGLSVTQLRKLIHNLHRSASPQPQESISKCANQAALCIETRCDPAHLHSCESPAS